MTTQQKISTPLTAGELLLPRIKRIAPYPGMPADAPEMMRVILVTEEILVPILFDGEKIEISIKIKNLDQWEHIFYLLEWWKERSEEEMPKYVKAIFNEKLVGVYKIWKWNMAEDRGYITETTVVGLGYHLFPATEEEYLTQNNLSS